MSEQSKIQWCDATVNFWIGCEKISPGCKNCYAEISTPTRVARSKGVELWGTKNRQRASDSTFNAPLRWNENPWVCDHCGRPNCGRPNGSNTKTSICKCTGMVTFHRRRVFSLSLGDWLDDAVPIEWLADMLDVIRRCPNLDFLLLTKRPENWRQRLNAALETQAISYMRETECGGWLRAWMDGAELPKNISIGTTVEDQKRADERIPHLLKIPAVCRFLSVEPMLEGINLNLDREWGAYQYGNNSLFRKTWGQGIHQVIVGGESGHGARPFNIEWARSIVAQCKAAGVACFVKQLGAKPYIETVHTPSDSATQEKVTQWLNLKDKKGGDPSEWPTDLRIREFPTVKLA